MEYDIDLAAGAVIVLQLRQNFHVERAAHGALKIAENIQPARRRRITERLILVGGNRLAQARDQRGQQQRTKLHASILQCVTRCAAPRPDGCARPAARAEIRLTERPLAAPLPRLRTPPHRWLSRRKAET